MQTPILLALVGLSISTAQAAEATGTLTLACKGTQISRGAAGTSSDQISIGIVVDFQKRTVAGISDLPVKIDGVDEATVSFSSSEISASHHNVLTGILDRGTRSLTAASSKFDSASGKSILSLSYRLQCKPTQRMF
jgi:hypothetical protein